MLTYPPEFAESIWLPFSAGAYREFIADHSKTREEYMADERTEKSETGFVYPRSHRESLWKMVVGQRRRVQSFYECNPKKQG